VDGVVPFLLSLIHEPMTYVVIIALVISIIAGKNDGVWFFYLPAAIFAGWAVLQNLNSEEPFLVLLKMETLQTPKVILDYFMGHTWFFLAWIVTALGAANMGGMKGHSAFFYLLFGAVAAPLALLIATLIPSRFQKVKDPEDLLPTRDNVGDEDIDFGAAQPKSINIGGGGEDQLECPNCSSTDLYMVTRKELNRVWEHALPDGSRDPNVSRNQAGVFYELSLGCTDCDHQWKERIMEFEQYGR
jgi:hypothetical protein